MPWGGRAGVEEGRGVRILVDEVGGYSSLDYGADEADHGLT